MKQRKIFHLVGATLSLVAMGMTSAVYAACTYAQGTNQGSTTIVRCSMNSPCNGENLLSWKQAADNCAIWCCSDGKAYYDDTCVFHNKTYLGGPDCCYPFEWNKVYTTWSCNPD